MTGISCRDMTAQLALNLRLRDGSSFGNFLAGGNGQAVARLHTLIADAPPPGPSSLYLWGEAGSGKSHLLQAACRSVQTEGKQPMYVPFGEPGIEPLLLEAADEAFLVCLDDVDRIAGNAEWERAIFALYELMRSRGARLVAAAKSAPVHLGLVMPELITRFGWGEVYQLQLLTDEEKIEAIRLRAHNRGFDVPVDVSRYILRRYPRDLDSLFALLDRIDDASLASQRRITIPFLRELADRAK